MRIQQPYGHDEAQSGRFRLNDWSIICQTETAKLAVERLAIDYANPFSSATEIRDKLVITLVEAASLSSSRRANL